MGNVPEFRDSFNLKDATLRKSNALPTADGTIYTTGIDLSTLTAKGARLADAELKIDVDDLDATQLPNGDTLTFSVLGDTVLPIDSSSVVVHAAILSMAGADSAGDGPEHVRYKIPSDFSYRYIGLKAVAAGGTGDISGSNVVTSIVF